MRIEQDAASGKYLTYFYNETSIRSCITDADCGSAFRVCNGNFTEDPIWAIPNMCVCPFRRSRLGDDCDVLTPFAQNMTIANIIFAITSFLACLYCIKLVYQSHEPGKYGSALQTTLLACCIGLFGSGLQFSYEATAFLMADSAQLKMYKPLDHLGVILVFIFMTIAQLNVSLLWIEVAHLTRNGKNKAISNINTRRLTIVLSLYYGTVGLAVPILILVDATDFALIVTIPAMLFIIITYTYGAYQMRRVLRNASSEDETFKRLYERVIKAACGVVFFATFIIASAAVTAVELYPTPTPYENHYYIAMILIFMPAMCGMIIVMLYCGVFVQSKVAKASTSSKGNFNDTSSKNNGIVVAALASPSLSKQQQQQQQRLAQVQDGAN